MIKAVMFDFDGVLTLEDSGTQSICTYISAATGVEENVFEREYRKYNIDLLTGKLTHEEIWAEICSAVCQDIDISVLYDSFINTPINSEMLELVRKLKSKNYKVGMVTDNKTDRIKNIIAYHKWDNIFDGVVVSAEVGSGKIHEAIFREIFQVLDLSPYECVFIDNNKKNLVIPERLGVTALFFDHNKNDVIGLTSELFELGVEV